MSKKIVFDTDVLSHLAKAKLLKVVFEFYKDRICIPIIVVEEISAMNSEFKQRTDPNTAKMGRVLLKIFEDYKVEQIDFEDGSDELISYRQLTTGKEALGKGEASCIAIAMHNDKIISSCNYRDISKFIADRTIENKPILEILVELYKANIKTLPEIEEIKKVMESKGAILPQGTIKGLFDL